MGAPLSVGAGRNAAKKRGTHTNSAQKQGVKDDDVDVARNGENKPNLPHERDQSSENLSPQADQTTGPRAAKDVQQGMPDTGRGPVVEELSRTHFNHPGQGAEATPANQRPGGTHAARQSRRTSPSSNASNTKDPA